MSHPAVQVPTRAWDGIAVQLAGQLAAATIQEYRVVELAASGLRSARWHGRLVWPVRVRCGSWGGVFVCGSTGVDYFRTGSDTRRR